MLGTILRNLWTKIKCVLSCKGKEVLKHSIVFFRSKSAKTKATIIQQISILERTGMAGKLNQGGEELHRCQEWQECRLQQ